MRKPAWTRRTRVENLNQNVLFHLPHWTAEDVARHRAEGERMAARVAELSQPSDPLSHIHDFPCFAGQCPVDHQPTEWLDPEPLVPRPTDEPPSEAASQLERGVDAPTEDHTNGDE
jgi:hypothetical protein